MGSIPHNPKFEAINKIFRTSENKIAKRLYREGIVNDFIYQYNSNRNNLISKGLVTVEKNVLVEVDFQDIEENVIQFFFDPVTFYLVKQRNLNLTYGAGIQFDYLEYKKFIDIWFYSKSIEKNIINTIVDSKTYIERIFNEVEKNVALEKDLFNCN